MRTIRERTDSSDKKNRTQFTHDTAKVWGGEGGGVGTRGQVTPNVTAVLVRTCMINLHWSSYSD